MMNVGGQSNNSLTQPQYLVSDDGPALVGQSALFQHVIAVLDAVAEKDCVVLIEGESGTGKELFAKRLHNLSTRAHHPFIPVNCAGISESLFESQFYGHVKGAFTGAESETLGIVRAADGGTLLLDEVGELPVHLQAKLLRLLQQREVVPVGAAHPIPVDVRFVASTNRSLLKSVHEGTFRADLYHRLNIVRIEIPPLRARTEDIRPLVEYYLDQFAEEYQMPRRTLSERLLRSIETFPWMGNVRELCGYLERMYATGLPPMPPSATYWDDGYRSVESSQTQAPSDLSASGRMPLNDDNLCTLAEAEENLIRRTLKITRDNRTLAARKLDIHRSTLLRKLRRMGLE